MTYRPNSITASINSTVDRPNSTPDRYNSTCDRYDSMTYRPDSTTATCNSDTYSLNSTADRYNFDTYRTNSTKNSITTEPTLRIAAHLQFAQALPQAKNCKRAALPHPKKPSQKKLFLIWCFVENIQQKQF